MPGFLTERVIKRASRGLPIVQIWTLANLAVLAGQHAGNLEPSERRRLVELVRRGRGRPARLDPAEASELRTLVARLQPRLFAGTAASRLSPVPLPRRMLYGGKGHPARRAAAARDA